MGPRSETRRTSASAFAESAGDPRSTLGGEVVLLRDGSSVVMRPLAADDHAAIASWFAGLSAETRYARFFCWLEQIDPRTLSELARIDHLNREAVAAFADDRTTVGIARYIRIGELGTAEVAVAVADDWRGRGVAGLLLARVAARAREVGIERFIALCLATNDAVIRVLSRLGKTTISPYDDEIVELQIDLGRTDPGAAHASRE